MTPLSGKREGIPYSLSRWTDVPAAKWGWFREALDVGQMWGVDPRTGVPVRWSLAPEDTLGLVFWTKDPTNLLADRERLRGYQTQVHVTLTGWAEVEKGAPDIQTGIRLLNETVDAFGAANVTWRFSPVPLLPPEEVLARYNRIATGVRQSEVFVSFLQENDLMPETRTPLERGTLLWEMAEVYPATKILLCNEDQTTPEQINVGRGVCAPGFRGAADAAKFEGCGCILMADPFTINESCTLGCEYCLSPDTLILYEDFTWRPLGDAQVGDVLIGFDEHPPGSRQDRKFRTSVVEGVWNFRKPALRLCTESSEVITTAEHLWFEGKTRKAWKRTDHLALDCQLHQFGVHRGPDFTMDYKAGYLAGMTLGDGTMRVASDKQSYWRVALADLEPLHRLSEYAREFGIDAPIRPFNGGPKQGPRPMFKVETRAKTSLRKIQSLMAREGQADEYRRGFLAGLFDAEGSYNKNLRIHQTQPNGLLERASEYAGSLGLSLSVEGSQKSARVAGAARDRAKFFSMVQPAIMRKTKDFFGRSIDFQKESVQAIERVGMRDVVDIKTSTRTFLAQGLATHNCYAADRSLSSKKRNTTRGRRLEVIR